MCVPNITGYGEDNISCVNEMFKVRLSLFKKYYFICFIENNLKVMKNDFHFILKAFFVLKLFNVCLDFLELHKKGSIRKIGLISKFITSEHGKQTIAIHILPDIARSKSNQVTKSGQLIEYNKVNISLQKSCRK